MLFFHPPTPLSLVPSVFDLFPLAVALMRHQMKPRSRGHDLGSLLLKSGGLELLVCSQACVSALGYLLCRMETDIVVLILHLSAVM